MRQAFAEHQRADRRRLQSPSALTSKSLLPTPRTKARMEYLLRHMQSDLALILSISPEVLPASVRLIDITISSVKLSPSAPASRSNCGASARDFHVGQQPRLLQLLLVGASGRIGKGEVCSPCERSHSSSDSSGALPHWLIAKVKARRTRMSSTSLLVVRRHHPAAVPVAGPGPEPCPP